MCSIIQNRGSVMKNKKGFTLIEIIGAVIIIGIISIIAVITFTGNLRGFISSFFYNQ